MPHKTEKKKTHGHKKKTRPKSPKRRKSSPSRKHGSTRQETDVQDVNVSDITLYKPSEENPEREEILVLDATKIVSPESYKEFARTSLKSYPDKTRHANESVPQKHRLHHQISTDDAFKLDDVQCSGKTPWNSEAGSDKYDSGCDTKQVSEADDWLDPDFPSPANIHMEEPKSDSRDSLLGIQSDEVDGLSNNLSSEAILLSDRESDCESDRTLLADQSDDVTSQTSSEAWKGKLPSESDQTVSNAFEESNGKDRLTENNKSYQTQNKHKLSVVITNFTGNVISEDTRDISWPAHVERARSERISTNQASEQSLSGQGNENHRRNDTDSLLSQNETSGSTSGSAGTGSSNRRRQSAKQRVNTDLIRQSEHLLQNKKYLQRWGIPSLRDEQFSDLFVINSIRDALHNSAQRRDDPEAAVFKAAPMATSYDVDSEHAYIMAKALRAYREHVHGKVDHASDVGTLKIRSPEPPPSKPSDPPKKIPVVELSSQTLATGPPATAALSQKPTRPRAQSARPSYTSPTTNSIDINIHPDQVAQMPLSRPISSHGMPSMRRFRGLSHAPSSVPSTPTPPASRSKVAGQFVPTHHTGLVRDVERSNSIESNKNSRPVLRTSRVFLSMDRPRTSKDHKRQGQGHQQVEVSFFNNTRPKRQYFSIHPEWVSENLSVQPMSISNRMHTSATFPPPQRRCKSAPPPGSRNPITWENPDMTEVRLRQSKRNSKPRPKSEVMDSIGTKSKEEKVPKVKFDGTFFAATSSPRKQYFTIHPEWVSEASTGRSKPISYEQRAMTFPPRRCKSAPPRTRNPITWENPDTPDRR